MDREAWRAAIHGVARNCKKQDIPHCPISPDSAVLPNTHAFSGIEMGLANAVHNQNKCLWKKISYSSCGPVCNSIILWERRDFFFFLFVCLFLFFLAAPRGLWDLSSPIGVCTHQNTGVGSLSLLQGIFLTQESNQHLLHCRWVLYQRNYQGNLKDWVQNSWASLVAQTDRKSVV